MSDPGLVHETLCLLARTRNEFDYEVGRWLLAGRRLELHKRLGFTSYAAYVQHIFDIDGRMARERVRVAKDLEGLPSLSRALREGELSWSAVREISRVATEETEDGWLDHCRGLNSREIEAKVSRHKKGDDSKDKSTVRPLKRIVLEVSEETFALFEEAKKVTVREAGASVNDDSLMATLARAFLGGGSRDAGTASYQIAMVTCQTCRETTTQSGAEQVPVDEATLERARCDATELGTVDAGTPPRASQTVPPKIRRAVVARDHGSCAVPGCRHAAFVDVHHTERRADGGGHDPDRLITLCGAHHDAVHRGALVIEGTHSSGFEFRHADRTMYGAKEACAARAGVLATVLELLVTMGFKHREAQRMCERAAPHVGHRTTVEDALKIALSSAPMPRGYQVREEHASYGRLLA